MKNAMLLILLFLVSSLQVHAQKEKLDLTYKTAIGVRYQPFGVSLKINNSYKHRSVEFIGYFNDGFVGAGYYYWNFILDKNHTFQAYIGGGVQGGYIKESDGEEGAMGGVAGIIGLDYKFKKLPINISVDWQPSYQVGENSEEFQGEWGGIALRVAF